MSRAEIVLNRGLREGFAMKRPPDRRTRGGVDFAVVDLKLAREERIGGSYHDEWIKARIGGGQEIAESGDEAWTRLYAGGIPADEALSDAGTNKQEVLSKLREFILGSDLKTRLHDDYSAGSGEWSYSYSVLASNEQIGLTVGLESISYRDVEVFTHGHLISPIIR